MSLVLQGMGDFLNEMVTMMSQTTSNVSPFFLIFCIFFCLLIISETLGDNKARHKPTTLFYVYFI